MGANKANEKLKFPCYGIFKDKDSNYAKQGILTYRKIYILESIYSNAGIKTSVHVANDNSVIAPVFLSRFEIMESKLLKLVSQ